MKTNRINKEKQVYISPVIRQIRLDKNISLQLQSTPPTGPGEPTGFAPEHFNKNPYKASHV